MNKWTTIRDIPRKRTWKGHTYEYVLTDSGDAGWDEVAEAWPRLARKFDGAFKIIRDGSDLVGAYLFAGRIPYIEKPVSRVRVQR